MFTVYIKAHCPYSQKAMRLLKENKIKFEKHDVYKFGDTSDVIAGLKQNKFIPKASKHKTVPIVFGEAGEFIGGCSELEKFLSK